MNPTAAQLEGAAEPQVPVKEPETEPRPQTPRTPDTEPALDPFQPDWPDHRPEPQPKAVVNAHPRRLPSSSGWGAF